MLTLEEIDCVQRIGRDEANRRTSIGLAELDALCEAARAGVSGSRPGMATYQCEAARTECDQSKAQNRFATYRNEHGPSGVRFNHAVVGLAGEVGELASLAENWLYYGRPLDPVKVGEELGDCLWYVALACNALGLNLSNLMEANLAKLRVRYPDRYADDRADRTNRDRDAEQAAMAGEEGVCKRTVAEVLQARITIQGCCDTFADRQGCNCLTDAQKRESEADHAGR